jgi:hypothetical protein
MHRKSKAAVLAAAGYTPKPVAVRLTTRPSYAPPALKQVSRG